ncbi:sensor histidine kinase [Crocinitomix catalasitica]|uniref:sensor histidine kinase n=1 Tax=Crocinitomix catalasitica TaxID=184607 RepID=UPI000488AC2D|nr:histidine kinase [Crocinitomix catalasitica]
MITILKSNNWLVAKVIILISILIPLSILFYEFFILGKDSVVFLADYPAAIGFVIILYYCLLILLGLFSLIRQIKAIFSLKIENKKSELQHLQNQVSPHFFFNMLNNIYGLIDKDSEQAKNIILKLSDLMRYSIYDGEKSSVLLEEEVDFLQNYIELHKMRYRKEVDIQFNMKTEKEVKIPPLLLIILVENAFKHGVENLRENAYVHIQLTATKKKILFTIENNYDQKENQKEKGIGIKNLKRRLALIYPKKHNLNFTAESHTYKASLEIEL